MYRRRVLQLGSVALAGLAGCADRGADGTAPATDGTRTPTESAATDASFTVALDALQPGFVALDVDAYEMVSNPRSQYLFLDVSVDSGAKPSLSEFRFRFDGDGHPPVLPTGDSWAQRPNGEGDSYDSGSGWVLFELPETGDASDAALVWPGGEWRPDGTLRERLAAELPSLSLTEWSVPETVPLESESTFEFTVANGGDRAGRFVAAINADGWMPHRPVAVVSHRIPAGGSESWDVAGEEITLVEEPLSESVGDGDPDITYELVWTGGSRSRQVRVVEA